MAPSSRSRIFHIWDASTPEEEDKNISVCKIFSQNCTKMKKIAPRVCIGGGRIPGVHLPWIRKWACTVALSEPAIQTETGSTQACYRIKTTLSRDNIRRTIYHFNYKEVKACHGNCYILPTKHYLERHTNCKRVKAKKFLVLFTESENLFSKLVLAI